MRLIKSSLLSLLLFFAADSFSQQKISFNAIEIDFIESEALFKKYPIKINLKKDKIEHLEESFHKIGLPFYEEFNLLLRADHGLSLIHQDFKRLQKSFTSYKLFKENNFESELYIINPEKLRNIKDYEIILDLKIKL